MATRRIGNITVNYTPTQAQTQVYDMIGRDAGQEQQGGSNPWDDFWAGVGKKFNSAENAFGTTLSVAPSMIRSGGLGLKGTENMATEDLRKDNKARMNDVAKKYGFNSYQELWNKYFDAVDNDTDKEFREKYETIIAPELDAQADENAEKTWDKASDYQNYLNDDYAAKKIAQDRGKFAGSALNTLSTAYDIASMASGIPNGFITNGIQGAVEGFADELEQNGLENFDWERAGKNAAIGAASGAATGALNAGLGKLAAKNGGNLIKGSGMASKLTNGVLNSGIGRGAMSGAVGGFAGGFTSGITNGEDAVSSLQSGLAGAGRGAISGAVSGGITSAANKLGTAIAKRTNLKGTVVDPITGEERQRTLADKLHENTQTWNNWKKSGDTFSERLKNTSNSGDSWFGNAYNTLKNDVVEGWRNRQQNNDNSGYMQGYVQLPGAEEGSNNKFGDRSRIKMDGAGTFVYAGKAYEVVEDPATGEYYVTRNRNGFPFAIGDENYPTAQKAFDAAKKIIDQEDGFTPSNNVSKAATTQRGDMNQTDQATAYLNNAIGLEDLNDEQLSQVIKRLDTMKAKAGSPISEEYNRIDRSQYLANEELAKRNFASGLSKDLPDSVREYLIQDYELRDVPYDSPRGQLKTENYRKVVNQLRKDYSDKQLAKFIQNDDFDAETQALFETAIEMPAPTRLKKVKNALTGFKEGYIQMPGAEDEKAYTKALNQAINDNLSGPEVSDIIAEYSGLPEKVDMATFKNLITDPDVYKSATEVANYYKSMGDDIDITLDDLAGDLWNEVRAQYATNLYSQAPTTNDNRPDVYAPDTNAYSDDINNMRINRNDMLDSSADAPETALYRALTGDQERAAQTIPMAQSSANSQWDNLAREYGYGSYDDAIRAYQAANPGKQVTAGAVTTWLDANEGNYNPNAVAVAPENSLESAFENKVGTIQKRNKLQELGNAWEKAGEAVTYSEVYDSLDPKTATRAQKTKAVQRLSEMGVKPRDYEEYAKTSSEVNRIASELADKSGVKVIAPGLATQLSSSNLDVNLTDDAEKTYNNYVKQIVADGSTPDEYSAGYLLEKSRWLGDKAEKVRGSNADDIKQALRAAKWVLRDKVSEAMANSGVTGDGTTELLAQNLKNLGANQKVIDYYTAPGKNGKAPNISELINRSSLFEQARDMGTQIGAEAMTRSASKYPAGSLKSILRAGGVDQAANLIAKQFVAPVTGGAMKLTGKAISAAGNAANNVGTGTTSNFNSGTTLANIIGREAGLENIPQEAQPYVQAASNLDTAIAADPNVAVSDVNTPSSAQTAVYDTLSGNTGTTTGATGTANYGGGSSAGGYFSNTGNDQLDLLGRAMELAMEADDATAFGTLYDMYNNYAKSLTSGTTELNATQQNQLAKIQSASDAIDELEDLFIGATGGKGPIKGNLQGWAGIIGLDNGAATYNDSREGIAATIAQALGGSRTEGTTKRIAAMLPQLTDSEETATAKLETLRKLLSDAQNNYASAYGVASY